MTAPGLAAGRHRPEASRVARSRLFSWVSAESVALALAIAAVLAAAFWLRFADLASNPGGLFPDEAAEAVDAQRLLHWQGLPPVWFTSDGGREALYAYLVAGMFEVLGQTVFALRATSALLGVAGVVAIGALAGRLGRVAGISAAAWTAAALWLVAIDRDGMRNAIVPVAGAIAMLALLWWASVPSTRRSVVAGALTSLAALYTYQPLKLLPVLVVLWVLWLRHADRASYLRLRPYLRSLVAAFVVVAIPMAIAAVMQPANYFGRVAAVTPFNPGVQADDSLPTHVLRTLGMFTFVGDPNARHNVDATPMLGDPFVAWPLFVLGCAGVARLWARRSERAASLLLIALAVFMVPPLPAVEGGSPHFLRALGLATPVAVAIGAGVESAVNAASRLGSGLARRRPGLRVTARLLPAAVLVGAAVLFAAEAVTSGGAYFARPAADRYFAYSYHVVAIAERARAGDAVIVDQDSGWVVSFIARSEPDLFLHAVAVPDPSAYQRFFALNRAELEEMRLRLGTAATIEPISRSPNGDPQAWMLDLSGAP